MHFLWLHRHGALLAAYCTVYCRIWQSVNGAAVAVAVAAGTLLLLIVIAFALLAASAQHTSPAWCESCFYLIPRFCKQPP